MKVLVTGAAGFVGYHVVKYLLETTDCAVVTLDRHLPIHEDLQANHILHDLCSPISSRILDKIGDVDAVINLASSSDVTQFLVDPVRHATNNVISTLNLLEWARHRGLRAFIQLSTNEVYGPTATHDIGEWAPLVPQTPYSASKAAQEMMAIGWWKTYDVPVVIVNAMHIFGEYQPAPRFIPQTVRRLLSNAPVTIYGQQIRSTWRPPARQWMYAPDLAHGLYRILTHDVARSTANTDVPDRWNVVGTEMTCLDVAEQIAERLGVDIKIDWQSWRSGRPGYDMRYALDGSAFMKFGYAPLYGTTVGIQRTVDWLAHRENR